MKKVLFILLSTGYMFVHAQSDYLVDKIDSRKNLTSDNVFDIIQDKEGYMWFCTDEGLNRYDGYDIKVFKSGVNNYSFTSNHFTCIEEDNSGNLWMGTKYDGLNIFNKETQEINFVTSDPDSVLRIPHNSIQSLLFDSRERMWVVTYKGLAFIHKDSSRAFLFNEDQVRYKVYPKGSIVSIFQDSGGDLFFGTWTNGFYKYLINEDKFIHYSLTPDGPSQNEGIHIWSFEQVDSDTYWIGTWESGLYKVKIGNNELEVIEHFFHDATTETNILNSNIVYSLHLDDDSNLWAGTPRGISIIDDVQGSYRTTHINYSETKKGLSNREAWKIIQDQSGVVWVATLGGGVNAVQVNRQTFKTRRVPDIDSDMQSQIINSFFKLNNKELLIGARSIGFGKYNLNDHSFRHYTQIKKFANLPGFINSVYCFHLVDTSTLLIGTRYMGLFSLDLETSECNHILPPDETNYTSLAVNCIAQDQYHCLWVGTDAGLFKLVPAGNGRYSSHRYVSDLNAPSSLSGQHINKIHIDRENIIWIATNKGLHKLNNIKNSDTPDFKPLYICKADRTAGFNTVYEDSEHSLWFGSENHGLFKLDKKSQQLRSFEVYQSILGESVYDIIEDNAGNLWITTNIGLVRLTLSKTEKVKIQRFDFKDGLQGNRFNKGAILKDQEGLIYLGGNYGFNIFEPKNFKGNNFVPPVVITDLEINNQPINHHEQNGTLQLPVDKNNIKITFSALSYTNPEKNVFAYQLQGFDENWIYTDFNRRDAVYTNLSPGKYVFKVKAANDSYVWNEKPVSFSFKIRPSPFKTWYAYLFYLMVISGVIFILYRLKLNSERLKQNFEIEKIKHREQEKINEFKFRFFTNVSHEFLTPLSVISASVDQFVTKKEHDLAALKPIKYNATRLMKLINQLLDFRKLESGSMKLNIGRYHIDDFFNQLYHSYLPITSAKKINLVLEGNINKSVYFDADLIDKVIANLLSNAVKHTEQGDIIIYYNLNNTGYGEELMFSIIDSGKGIKKDDLENIFNRFYQCHTNGSKKTGFGIGLSLCKNLIELHKGTITANNRKDNQGAVFSVKIPVGIAHYKSDEMIEDKNETSNFEFTENSADENGEPGLNFIPPVRTKEKTVLVVEDNVDLRSIVCGYLSDYYNVVEAFDGNEGYDKTIALTPNVVVCDVMMPNMDGYEMCRKIKNNFEVSHIQVIMLTAKVTNEDRVDGYQVGADSYLTKPINLKLLHARIESLLAQRERIKQKFSQGLLVATKNGLTEADKEFIDSIIAYIKNKIGEQELSVASLRTQFNMSNSSFFRKIRELTGMSPNEFIRYIRMQEAAKIMQEQGKNVTETAILVGINDIGYFVQCFKKQFGKTPKKFINS